jgi:hypothetical protein
MQAQARQRAVTEDPRISGESDRYASVTYPPFFRCVFIIFQ